jgi:predicted GNAT family acetyltransferase
MPPNTGVPVDIRHEPGAARFVADIGAATAYLTYRELGRRVLDLDHTFVPEPLRGRGIASRLTAQALQYAQDNGYRIVPSCPFVARYIAGHARYRRLLA